ncbi:hypothetical protein HOU03_gp366 [Caulobacter phage CcrSC]|uniref:Uncharacterized protein n=1 Tax=Caulobacter phage CcrSC TaxID=2283272 RepID=A0A385EG43_9CAUD|nr:hypothetical protein HOU03_gp366 [Caulobacter phage CcrSC]AXQ69902.1 hypothetical protein CcrSC_gp320 [Caulobacter phage CcrSC]
MSITMPAQKDADGNWPETAYTPVEPFTEGSYPTTQRYDHEAKKSVLVYDEFDPATGRYVQVTPMFGPYRRNHLVGYRPTEHFECVMAETYKGRVLSLGEVNGYHDSDFYAIAWNPEKPGYDRIEYASTRGYTYHCSAYVDATDEVRAAAQAYDEEQTRLRIEARAKAVEDARADYAKTLEVDTSVISRLEQAYGQIDPRPISTYGRYGGHYTSLSRAYGFTRESNALDAVLALIISAKKGRLRSEFKKNLAAQVMAWLADPAPKYPTPLSTKQLQYI